MKLSDLVSLKQDIESAFDTTDIIGALKKSRSSLEIISNRYNLDQDYLAIVENTIKLIDIKIKELDIFVSRKTLISNTVSQDIEHLTKKFFAANYETEFVYDTADSVRKARSLYVPRHAEPVLMSKIGSSVDWRYPTLEIGCRDGEFTKHLVAGDPLYITDIHQEFLDSSIRQFSEEYQRRIRPYLIKDQDFSTLPQGQFGFIFSWNHFNYLSLDTIKHYLQQAFDLLRPGGKILFSYNNGDLPDSADYAERYYMTYMPKSMLIPMCEMLGFEVIDTQDFQPAVSWIELKRPGEIRTVKAHQVIGEIKKDDNG